MRSHSEKIERLIAERPSFHAWQDGTAADWAVSGDVLRFIYQNLEPGMRTLETGAGQTTVAFALAGMEHVCITPDRAEAERITAYLDAQGVPHRIRFLFESSDIALPAGHGIPEELDFVLIDGAHRFPLPIIDWHFTEGRLRVNGMLSIDDYAMPSVRILHDFLLGEEEWALERIIAGTSFFRRTRPTVLVNDWQGQRINRPGRIKRARNRSVLGRWLGRLRGS